MSDRGRATPWVVLGVVWFTLGAAYGLFFSFTIFFVSLIEEFRWSRGLTAGAFSLSTVIQGVVSPGIGILAFLTAMGFCGVAATCFWAARPHTTRSGR